MLIIKITHYFIKFFFVKVKELLLLLTHIFGETRLIIGYLLFKIDSKLNRAMITAIKLRMNRTIFNYMKIRTIYQHVVKAPSFV